ncbi:MAG: PrsW family intramembrane metalloprotease [Firmicutes bacterium]|jgi:RsiW-degrading membrane proteinase PrsW (M82 family)|nr:PrsW family intramembrane metalloprotease [Bacillota bacterium]MBR6503432.1 PrsW family intramembrane metalloprotease [Bacillota bacterium]
MYAPAPSLGLMILYIPAAVIPALLLMKYIYNKDTVEKEPGYLLKALVIGGVLATLLSIILETGGTMLLNTGIRPNSPVYVILLAFLVVAAAEEGTKLYFLKRRSWNDPNFTHLFDGVVYSAFVSLGFAAFENIQYVFTYGIGVILVRALFAIPGHLGFSVFMGIFYGRAKRCEVRGDRAGCRKNLLAAYLSAVFLHGFYDSCAMIDSPASTAVFYGFVIIMYIVVYRLIRDASTHDVSLYS